MKSVSLLFVALFCWTCISAQPFPIAYSEPFEEPRGSIELLQCSDGKTVLLSITSGDIRLRIFDKDHKQIADQRTEHNKWSERKSSAATYKGIYEVGDHLVMFFTMLYRDNMLALHRLVFSPTSGQMVKTDEITRIPTRRNYSYELDEFVSNDFYIAQDPVSKHYAVLMFEGYTENKADRVKVQVYGTDNNLLREATLRNTESERFVRYAGMDMYNGDVFLAINDFNPKNKKKQDVPIHVSIWKNGTDAFIAETITGMPCNKESMTRVKYNPGTNLLHLVTHTITDSESKMGFNKTTYIRYYVTGLITVDPANLKVISIVPYRTPKADAYTRQKLGDRRGFNGTQPELRFTHNNALVWVGSENRSYTKGNHSWTAQAQMGVSYLDNNGVEVDAYVVRTPELTGMSFSAGTGVFTHEFVSTPSGDYVIYNDLPENFKLTERQQPNRITTISDANTVVLRMADGKVEKQYLFGEPENKKSSNFSRTAHAVFDKKTGTYVTFMVRNREGKKTGHIAWVDMNRRAQE